MKIYVDADACPVKEIVVETAKKYDVEVNMFFDTSHMYFDGYSRVFIVDKGADSVDFVIANKIEKGDVCITQDYGLAAMLLAREAYVVHQNGFLYTKDNIDRMLFERHVAKKVHSKGKRGIRHKARTEENNMRFKEFFEELIKKLCENKKSAENS